MLPKFKDLIIQKEFTCDYMYMTMLAMNEDEAGFPMCLCHYYTNDIKICGQLIMEDSCPINKGNNLLSELN